LTELNDFVNAPDLVYDFFGMGLRFIRYNKDILFRSTQIETLLAIWLKGIGIEHKDASETHT
jgi:hypothetical protein